jgi:hypothetical protein
MLAGMPKSARPKAHARSLGTAFLITLALDGGGARGATDPIAAEIDRWTAFVNSHPATDDIWKEIKPSSEAVLVRARDALAAGRRLLALQRLAYAREQLLAARYIGERSAAQRKGRADFEAEWTRMGAVLRADLATPPADSVAAVRPAAVRALAEAALPQVGIYYEASLEYGRNTMPDSGLYYLGAAQAQRDFVTFARGLTEAASGPPPPVRALGGELDLLESEMLAAYRPPLSIEKHPQFIAASSMLKEARELDAAGLRYGALLRYLQAAYRFAPLRAEAAAPSAGPLAAELERLGARLAAEGVDHSLGRLFLETAQSEAAAETGAANAAALARDVLPRYFAALAPAKPTAPAAAAQVTITLVRWPYT